MEKKQYGKVGYWLPAFIWMGFIFFLSSRQSVSVSDTFLLNFLFFKTLHVVEYAVLFTLFSRAVHLTWIHADKSVVLRAAFLLTMCYAASDEIHQWFVPSRSATVRDGIIDGIGAGFVWYFLSTTLPKAHPRLKNWVKQLGLPL